MHKLKKPKLLATEARLNALIHSWFAEQYPNKLPKQTLGRYVLSVLQQMPDEFFDWIQEGKFDV